MPLIIRAIITGFGYKIGAELGRYVAEKIGFGKKKEDKDKADDAFVPQGMDDAAPPEEPDADHPPTKPDDDDDDQADADAA